MADGEKNQSQTPTVIIGIVTIIATLATAIPAFVSLNRDRPLVYFTSQSISVLNPASPDAPRVAEVLRSNNVPTARTVIALENKGQGAASEVRVGLQTGGPVRDVSTTPSSKDRPVWVTIPPIPPSASSDSVVSLELKQMAPGRSLVISVAFDAALSAKAEPAVDVFYDGKPAVRVADLPAAQPLSMASTFRTPLLVLVGGMVLTMVVAFAVVLSRNASLARAVYEVLTQALELSTKGLWPFR
jgi:hypothetical protein